MNNELYKMRKKLFVNYSKYISSSCVIDGNPYLTLVYYTTGITNLKISRLCLKVHRETTNKLSQSSNYFGWKLNRSPSKYKSDILPHAINTAFLFLYVSGGI